MGLGAGLFVPLFLRWYWPRLNGYGFAFGTAAGMIAGIIFKAVLAWPLLWSFPGHPPRGLLGQRRRVAGDPADGPHRARGLLAPDQSLGLLVGLCQRRPGRAVSSPVKASDAARPPSAATMPSPSAFALPFQVSLLIAAMAFVFHDWGKFAIAGAVTLISAIGLYVFWYRDLKTPDACAAEDAHFEPLVRARIEPGTPRPGQTHGEAPER